MSKRGGSNCHRRQMQTRKITRECRGRHAILFSVGANDSHGLRRTNADKRRGVELLLRDEEWSKKSDRWIAEQCGVGHQLVATVRSQLGDSSSSSAARAGQDGKVRRLPPRKPPPIRVAHRDSFTSHGAAMVRRPKRNCVRHTRNWASCRDERGNCPSKSATIPIFAPPRGKPFCPPRLEPRSVCFPACWRRGREKSLTSRRDSVTTRIAHGSAPT
jgi:hypothetical protein